MVQFAFPILDRHGPFFRGRLGGQVYNLHRAPVMREDFTILGRLADDAVQGLDCIGGLDHLADGWVLLNLDLSEVVNSCSASSTVSDR